MKKIFYLLPMLLIGLAFFACDDEEDDGGAANTFDNPETLGLGSDKVIYGAELKDAKASTLTSAFDTDDKLKSPEYFKAGATGNGDSYDTPKSLEAFKVYIGKALTKKPTKDPEITKGGETYYSLQPSKAVEVINLLANGDGLELPKGTKIVDDDATKGLILDAVKALSAYKDINGTDSARIQAAIDAAFAPANLKVNTASDPKTVKLTTPSKTIKLTVAAGNIPTGGADGSTFAKAIKIPATKVIAGKEVDAAYTKADIVAADQKFYTSGTPTGGADGSTFAKAIKIPATKVIAGKEVDAAYTKADIVAADQKFYKP